MSIVPTCQPFLRLPVSSTFLKIGRVEAKEEHFDLYFQMFWDSLTF